MHKATPIVPWGQVRNMWPKRSQVLNILAYHAVVPTEPPLRDWCFLELSRFAAQMEAIRASGQPVLPLVEAVERLAEGRLERPSVVITFDDGFLNNVEVALPVLQHHGFPSTIFLTTGVTGTGRTLWPSRLVAALMATRAPRVSFGNETFALGDDMSRGLASTRLQVLIKDLRPDDPQQAVASIEEQLGVPLDAPVPRSSPFAMMGPEDIEAALGTGLVEFGAHTISHPLLSALDDKAVLREVGGSIDDVERLIGGPCRSFAYPNGRVQDYDARSLAVLAGRGIKAAVTTREATNDRSADRLRLARWAIRTRHPLLPFRAILAGLHPAQIRARLG